MEIHLKHNVSFCDTDAAQYQTHHVSLDSLPLVRMHRILAIYVYIDLRVTVINVSLESNHRNNNSRA